MLSINTNLSSLIAQSSMKSSTDLLNLAIERMTTGYKINHAKDNAANYSISTNMTTKIGSYNVAADNCAMGMDLVTTASDTVSLMQDKAHRLRALCTQARNGTYGAQSLAAINTEANAIIAEINRLYSTAEYNGVSLFTGGTATDSATPEVATFAMRRSVEPEVATFAMTRSAEVVVDETKRISKVSKLTSGETYYITTVEDVVALESFASSTSNVTIELAANIDMTGVEFSGYGSSSDNAFRGTFNGNGFTISNITSTTATGFFNYTRGATIKNLNIENINIDSSNYAGGLIAYGLETTVDNCHVTGTIKATGRAGGLFGYVNSTGANIGSTFLNSSFEGTVQGGGYSGGLIGYLTGNSTVEKCHAVADVTGTGMYIGGLVGYSSDNNSFSDCYTKGSVVSTGGWIGGLIGSANIATVVNCFSESNVSGSNSVGGLIGSIGGGSSSSSISLVSNSYATGSVTGTDGAIGGFIGSTNWSLSVDDSYSSGDIESGGSGAGGFVGSDACYTTVFNNCYATGNVSGNQRVGGFAGSGYGEANNCYATGSATGSSRVGGFYGQAGSSATGTNNSYNSDSNSNSVGYGTFTGANPTSANDLSNEEFLNNMGYTEENGWTIVDGKPLLSWQKEAQPVVPTPPSGGGSSSGGSYGVNAFNLQVGVNSDSSCQIGFDINFTYDLSAIEVDIASDEALATIDDFINKLSEQETKLGAVQNRLESALESISVNIENLTSSRSTIRDADIAEVSSRYIQQQILQQASATLLATANQSPAIALQLI